MAGRREWADRLARLAERMGQQIGEEDEEEAAPGNRRFARGAIVSLRALVERLAARLESLASVRRWSDMASGLRQLLDELGETDTGSDAVGQVLDSLALLDRVGEVPDLETFRRFVLDALASASRHTGHFQRNEPTVAGMMEARGVPFDTVILPGLVEKSFPQPARQDPILLDAERLALQQTLASSNKEVLLNLKGRRREEEALLFALAVGAARRRLVLTFPRVDPITARPRVPSYFLLRALEAIEGRSFDYAALDRAVRDGSSGRFVPVRLIDAANLNRAVNAVEYDLAALAQAEEQNQPGLMLYLGESGPFFRRSLKAENARWGQTKYSEYDGVFRSPEALRLIRERFNLAALTISPTQLEEYAACPFQYLMHCIFGIETVAEPEQTVSVGALDRGTILHGILWEFFSEEARAGRLPLRDDALARLEAIARKRLAAFERSGVTGYPLMWQIEKEQILDDLRRTFQKELKNDEGFVPGYFELRYGMRSRGDEESALSTEQPARFPVSAETTIRLKGRIDRIDVAAGGKLARIIDYKTGGTTSAPKENSFAGGRALQLPLYIVAAGQILKRLTVERAEYYFATRRGGWKRVVFTTEDWPARDKTLRQIVATIIEGIASGRFFPRPDEKGCEHCDFATVCAHGRRLDFKWQAESSETAAFKKMAEIE